MRVEGGEIGCADKVTPPALRKITNVKGKKTKRKAAHDVSTNARMSLACFSFHLMLWFFKTRSVVVAPVLVACGFSFLGLGWKGRAGHHAVAAPSFSLFSLPSKPCLSSIIYSFSHLVVVFVVVVVVIYEQEGQTQWSMMPNSSPSPSPSLYCGCCTLTGPRRTQGSPKTRARPFKYLPKQRMPFLQRGVTEGPHRHTPTHLHSHIHTTQHKSTTQ